MGQLKNGMAATIINFIKIGGPHDIHLLPQDARAHLNGIRGFHAGPNAMDAIDLLSRKLLTGFRSVLPWHLGAGEECHECHQFQ